MIHTDFIKDSIQSDVNNTVKNYISNNIRKLIRDISISNINALINYKLYDLHNNIQTNTTIVRLLINNNIRHLILHNKINKSIKTNALKSISITEKS